MRLLMPLLVAVPLLAAAPASAQTTTWELVLELPSGPISRVDFASPDAVWGIGPGSVFRSSDGGRTWSTALPTDVYLSDVAAVDASTAWAAGPNGVLFNTVDAGATWSRVDAGTDINLFDVEALDSQTLFAAVAAAASPT